MTDQPADYGPKRAADERPDERAASGAHRLCRPVWLLLFLPVAITHAACTPILCLLDKFEGLENLRAASDGKPST
jgi:hypothetical protein